MRFRSTSGAFFNSVFLLALALSIFLQSIERFIHIAPVNSPFMMMVIGCVGLGLNILSAFFAHGKCRNATIYFKFVWPSSGAEHHGHGHGHSHSHSHSIHGHSHVDERNVHPIELKEVIPVSIHIVSMSYFRRNRRNEKNVHAHHSMHRTTTQITPQVVPQSIILVYLPSWCIC